jgi:hypothetical protein
VSAAPLTEVVTGEVAAVWMLPLLLPELPGPSSSSSLSFILPLPPDPLDEEVVVLAAETVTTGAVVGEVVGEVVGCVVGGLVLGCTVGSCVGCQHRGGA